MSPQAAIREEGRNIVGFIAQRLPQVMKYNWFSAPLEKVVSASEPYYVFPTGVSLSQISADGFADVERARPGYSITAARYLHKGHVGQGIWVNDDLVAMGWYYYNGSSQRKRVTYYLLEPGHTWFHAVWVHSSHRGRGYQKLLIAARSRKLLEDVHSTVIETNIDPKNSFSQNNDIKCGFVHQGTIVHIRFSRFNWTWKRVTNR